MDETSFPFQEGRRNAGRKKEAEEALPTLCPCCTEKQWTSRGDASQAAGLEVGLLQTPSVCKGQRKPGAMNLGLHVAGTHGRDVEHEILSREVAEGSGRTWGVIVILSGRSLRNHLGHLYSPPWASHLVPTVNVLVFYNDSGCLFCVKSHSSQESLGACRKWC